MGFLEFFGVWFFLGFWFFLEVFGNVYKIFRVIYPSGILISWDEFFHQKDALFDTWLRFLECSLMKDGTYSGVFSLKIITFGRRQVGRRYQQSKVMATSHGHE